MLVKLDINDGYFTGNRQLIDVSDDKQIQLNKNTNSFAWDVQINDGDYDI